MFIRGQDGILLYFIAFLILILNKCTFAVETEICYSASSYSYENKDSVIYGRLKDWGTLNERINEFPPRKGQLNISLSVPITTENENGQCPYSQTDAKNLLNSIERIVLGFYHSNYHKVSVRLDSTLGLVILNKQLLYILKEEEVKLSFAVKELFWRLFRESHRLGLVIFGEAIDTLSHPPQKYEDEIMGNFSGLIGSGFNKWKSSDAISKFSPEFIKIGDEKEIVHRYLDYQCTVNLVESCSVPHVCKTVYLKEIYSQYMLLHQVLYQEFANTKSCIEPNQEVFGDVQLWQDRLCSKVYLEAQFLEKNNFPKRYLDLFAEQVGICGLLGYPNFMRRDWLQEILSWQSKSHHGCFTDVYEGGKTFDSRVLVEVVKKGNQSVRQETCLVHLTSASLGALAMNLRYMVDSCSEDIFSDYIPITA